MISLLSGIVGATVTSLGFAILLRCVAWIAGFELTQEGSEGIVIVSGLLGGFAGLACSIATAEGW